MKATVLIETLPAVFEMDEILHALRGRIVGLNCGRWDYIFSYIKTFRGHRDRVLPERGQIHMTRAVPQGLFGIADPNLPPPRRACDGRHGGADPDQHATPPPTPRAMARVRADKQREAEAGHDGTWVAHPGLIPVAQCRVRRIMPRRTSLIVRART
jgi:malate synthase